MPAPEPKPAPAPKKDEQVSKLKFEKKDDIVKRPPILFDQDCQTDKHMLEAWFAKKTLDNEAGTDPIKIEREVNNNSTMVQTEPDLDGIYRERDEPVPFEMPEGQFDKPGVQILKFPLPEMRLVQPPKTPLPIDERRDWVNSPLYTFLSKYHLREMLDSGKLKLLEGEKRPVTPTEEVEIPNKALKLGPLANPTAAQK